MNKLPTAKRAQILGMMVEGMSIRAISRMTGASKNTIVKLLVEAGDAFANYQDQAFRNLGCKRIQCDEIWSFVYAKDKNATPEMKAIGQAGDVWTWTAIDADSKLMVSWMIGDRSQDTARVFVRDVSERLSNRVQLTTDGYKAYLRAVDDAFYGDIDYAMLQKIYGSSFNAKDPSRRYSPGECTGTIKGTVSGCPDEAHVSTSYVERANLSMRMGMRRFTRLTNAFSKKIENHAAAISIYFMHYNFVRVHQTLRVTPAMEAKVTDKLMSLEDMVRIVDEFHDEKPN